MQFVQERNARAPPSFELTLDVKHQRAAFSSDRFQGQMTKRVRGLTSPTNRHSLISQIPDFPDLRSYAKPCAKCRAWKERETFGHLVRNFADH